MASPGPRIGVDLDNTVISYDALLHEAAVSRGLLDPSVPRRKQAVRDALRRLPGGEELWRGVQVEAYGPAIGRAEPMPGVLDFFAACRERSVPVWIVSHKTEYPNFGGGDVNLRRAALGWLAARGFVGGEAGLPAGRVLFGSTRREKVAHLAALNLTHFIDDLPEVYLEPDFPAGVRRLLFSPAGVGSPPAGVEAFASWREIAAAVLEPYGQ